MSNEKKVRALFADARTPAGLRMSAELWLGKRADEVLADRPEPALSEFLQEHFDKQATSELPPELGWLRDPAPGLNDGGGDLDLEGTDLAWLSR